MTPKYAAISASASGDNTAVAAVAGKVLRVLSYRFQVAGAVSVKFKSGDSTDLTGAMPAGGTGGGGGAAYSPAGHFQTASGEALVVNLSSAVAVGGHVCYLEI